MLHRELDQTFSAQVQSTDSYAGLLQLLHSLHTTADPLLQAWVTSSSAAPHVVIPTRAGALTRDLTLLGFPPAEPVCLEHLPRHRDGVLTDPAGLALLYVVAGSSIGARVILRSLTDTIARGARLGLTQGASDASAELWRHTLVALAAPVDASVSDPAATACQLIFRTLLAVPRSVGPKGPSC